MHTSDTGIKLIKTYEGLRLNSYLCPAGVWTIGYGSTGTDVVQGMRITEVQANARLKKDLRRFEQAISSEVKITLNQNQFDALVSFVFNVGIGAFKGSTLLRRLNAGENPSIVASEELPRWNKGANKVLEGLVRRRSSEVELFCSEAPTLKTGKIDIKSKRETWLKKQPIASGDLKNDQKALVNASKRIPGCEIIKQQNKHTLLELGFGMGQWWVFDEHWDGLVNRPAVLPYATQGDLRYLRNFPYFYQKDNGPEGWRQCQTSSIAMCLKYLDTPGINDDLDYLKLVNKYGDTTYRYPHQRALADLGVSAKFTQTADFEDVKEQIDKGLPVVAGILHHGTPSAPAGGGHFVVITGYNKTAWLVQDPFGELDLVNGGWAKQGPTAGQNKYYSFKNMNPRFFYGGGANGWCWLNFSLPVE